MSEGIRTQLGKALASGAHAAALAAAGGPAVAQDGTLKIGIVAFLSGPIARLLNGGRTTLAGAALTGAVIVVGADHVADYLLTDINFPVGVVTGALGAPFLLWLLASGRTGRRGA